MAAPMLSAQETPRGAQQAPTPAPAAPPRDTVLEYAPESTRDAQTPQSPTPPASTEEGRRLVDRTLQRQPGETRVQALERQERERAAQEEARRANEARQRAQMEQQGRDLNQRLDQAVTAGTMTAEGRAQVDAIMERTAQNVLDRIRRTSISMTPDQQARLTEILESFQSRVVNRQVVLDGRSGDAALILDTADMMLELQQTLNRDIEPLVVDIITTLESGVREISYVPGIETATPDIQRDIDALSRIPGRVSSSFGAINYSINDARSRIAENRSEYERRAQAYLDELHGRTLRETAAELDRLYPVAPPAASQAPSQPTRPAPTSTPSIGEPTQVGRSRSTPSREGLNPDGTPVGDPFAGLRVPAPQTLPPPRRPAPSTQARQQTPPPQVRNPPPQRQTPPPPVVLTQTSTRSDDGENIGGAPPPRQPQSPPMPATWTVGDTTYELQVYFENGRLNYRYSQTTRRLPPGRSMLVSDPALEGAMDGQWSVNDALAQAGNALGRLPDLRVADQRDPYPGLGDPSGLSVADLAAIYEGWDPYANGFHYPGPSSAAATPSSAPRSLAIDWYLPSSSDLSAQLAADRAAGFLAGTAAEMGMFVEWGGFTGAADPFRVGAPAQRSALADLWATPISAGEDAWGGRLYNAPNPWAYRPLAETSRDLARALYGPLWSDRPFQWAYDPTGLDNLFSQEGQTVAWLNGMSQRDYLRALIAGDVNTLSRLLAQPFNVLLTWGPGAFDLDLHMTGPSGADSTQRFHIYYVATGRLDDFPFAELIRDCICTSGSEVILTSSLVQGGVYRISVFNFGDQSAASTNLANTSGAVLQIVRGGQAVPQGNGTTIVGGRVIFTGRPPQDQAGNTWIAVEIDPQNGRIRAPDVITQNQGSDRVP
ncbi:MAG: hypothetical protein JNJ63_00460 [Hyphomonadaceae bacterium]|nr:hypothetical protein [Hyphomonadaceae bacterium]